MGCAVQQCVFVQHYDGPLDGLLDVCRGAVHAPGGVSQSLSRKAVTATRTVAARGPGPRVLAPNPSGTEPEWHRAQSVARQAIAIERRA